MAASGGPQTAIEVVVGEASHATTQEFQRLALDGEAFRATRTLTDALTCLRHVATNQHAITFASLSLDIPGVKTVRVDNIAPTLEAIRSGDYSLRRPLLLVAKATPQGDLKKFFDFAHSDEGQTIVAKHFVSFKPLQTTTKQ